MIRAGATKDMLKASLILPTAGGEEEEKGERQDSYGKEGVRDKKGMRGREWCQESGKVQEGEERETS